MGALLAVDAGIRTGLALFDASGRLVWCRSHNLGSTSRLKKAAARIVFTLPDLEWLVVEGGGAIAEMWEHTAIKQGVKIRLVQAHEWRGAFLLPRQQHSGATAKAAACALARAFVHAEGPSISTTLRHDAAEAMLLGLWAVTDLNWRTMPRLKT
ncbi:MAG: hypothetical protein GX043_03405 [Desulfovibrionales bacterium]|nr:hypothetical protein [Desulfovibrionales bacterium]